MKEEEKQKKKKFCEPPKKYCKKKTSPRLTFFSFFGVFLSWGGEKREEGRGRGRSSARVSLDFFFLSFPRIRSMCKKIINKKRGLKKNNNNKSDIRAKGGEAEDTERARAARI